MLPVNVGAVLVAELSVVLLQRDEVLLDPSGLLLDQVYHVRIGLVVHNQLGFSSLRHVHSHQVMHFLEVLVGLFVVAHCDSAALGRITAQILLELCNFSRFTVAKRLAEPVVDVAKTVLGEGETVHILLKLINHILAFVNVHCILQRLDRLNQEVEVLHKITFLLQSMIEELERSKSAETKHISFEKARVGEV